MITFKLNGREVQGEEGEYILEVAERYGVEIPTLCHHKALEPAGACRLCTVELFDGRRTRFVTACNYPIWEGMEVYTDTDEVRRGRKLIVELLLARCPEVPIIRRLAEDYGIEEPRFKKDEDDCILCGLCTRICERMGNGAISLAGRGVGLKVTTPFEIQSDLCMACGACVSVCPTGHIKLEEITKHTVKPIPSEYDMGLRGRKPIYVPYAQAVPNTPVIDRDTCMHFRTGECKICVQSCSAGAIDHAQQDEAIELRVGAIILAPGFQAFDPGRYEAYGYAENPNIVTSMEFERLLSASGPTMGHLVRPSDGKEPRRIAWVQCVGSRDVHRCDNAYCSSVCCMYAVKQAVIAKEHAGGELDCAIFYMDMRTHGKDFERYYNDARDKHGVRFIRSRIPAIETVKETGELLVPYVNEKERVVEERFDLVVLSVGLETAAEVVELAKKLGVQLTEGRFCKTDPFRPVATSREGIFVCGAFQGPKDIPQSVIEAGSAAAEAGALLSEGRNSLTLTREEPQERDCRGERLRVGVFVCRCGINIAGVVDVEAVRDYAASLPHVEYVADNLYTCSQDTQESLTEVIKEKNLNRIVVAACTPKTHEALFQETMANAGLNKYLFEMANIRNQDSWVHQEDPEAATAKAKDLVRMAVAKVTLLEPLREAELEVNQKALVVGGGVAGMTAARALSAQGYEVCLVERAQSLGGQARNLYRMWTGENIQERLEELIEAVQGDENIRVHLETELGNVEGFVGNFRTTLICRGKEEVVEHGIAVIATGAQELKPKEYLYGEDSRVVTHLELDRMFMNDESALRGIKRAVFIQCVGSREPERPYCSRVCCTHSIESALHLKELNPDMDVYILYRDIRTYGEREYLYRKARLAGILFIPFSLERKPRVSLGQGALKIDIWDPLLCQDIVMNSDLLVLAAAIVPYGDQKLARMFKVPLNEDGFFVEAHAKLGPSEFATDGVYLCGMAHYPKPIDESVAQAQAAVSRAVTLLARQKIKTSGTVAEVNPLYCSSCGVCVEVCPYKAPTMREQGPFAGKAEVNPVLCKGCGICVASCRSGAMSLKGFGNDQIMAMIAHM